MREGDKTIYTRLYLPDLFEASDPMYTKPQDKQRIVRLGWKSALVPPDNQ